MLKRRTHPPPPLHRHRPEEPMMVRLRSKLEATSLPFCGNYVAFSSRPRSGWQPITAKRIAAEKTFGQRHTHTSHTHSCVSDRKQLPPLLPPLLSTPFHHSEAAAPPSLPFTFHRSLLHLIGRRDALFCQTQETPPILFFNPLLLPRLSNTWGVERFSIRPIMHHLRWIARRLIIHPSHRSVYRAAAYQSATVATWRYTLHTRTIIIIRSCHHNSLLKGGKAPGRIILVEIISDILPV